MHPDLPSINQLATHEIAGWWSFGCAGYMLSATSRSDAVRASMILNHYVNNPTLRDDVLHVKTPPLSTRMRVHVRVQKAQPRQKTHWYKTLGLQPGVPGLRPDYDFGTHCHETSGTQEQAGSPGMQRATSIIPGTNDPKPKTPSNTSRRRPLLRRRIIFRPQGV